MPSSANSLENHCQLRASTVDENQDFRWYPKWHNSQTRQGYWKLMYEQHFRHQNGEVRFDQTDQMTPYVNYI